MTTSYVVTTGEYSSYSIRGVYSTREKAEYAAKLFRGDVEEFEIDSYPDHPRGLLRFFVRMERGGESIVGEAGPTEKGYQPHYFSADYWTGVQELWMHVWAKDEQHAVKIVNEKRGQLIAGYQWPDDEPAKEWPGLARNASTGLFHPPVVEIKLGIPDD